MPVETPTVFVVDDDASVRRSLTRMLFTFGYRVQAAESAARFLDLAAKASRPCCVILDVKLPDVDGLELQLRLNQAGQRMPIVFISGHGDIPMSVRAMKAGAIDFLSKPFVPGVLLAVVRHALDLDAASCAGRAAADRLGALVDKLTPRERQVMDLVAAGLPNKQIGKRLGVAEKTVKVHRGRVMNKLEVSNVVALVSLIGKIRAASAP